jgi:hypothetical protein
MPSRKALSPWKKFGRMVRSAAALHRCARRAHLRSPAPDDEPDMCMTKSTFPPMTDWGKPGMLETNEAVLTACDLFRKGRVHESSCSQSIANGSEGRGSLCLVRHVPPGRAQVEPGMAPGVLDARQRKLPAGSLSGLPAAQRSPAHRCRHQHSHVTNLWIIRTPCRLTPDAGIEDNGGGWRWAWSLACPSRQFWADGRRYDH